MRLAQVQRVGSQTSPLHVTAKGWEHKDVIRLGATRKQTLNKFY